MTGDEKFLNRWSRRKTAAATPRPPDAPLDDARDECAVAARPEDWSGNEDSAARKPDDIDLESLPDIDSMDENSDFSVFMQDGIPDALRNRALRKLWQTDPTFNVVDGLVEYGEDFTDLASVAEGLKTAYKVGKGMVDDDETAERDVPEDDTDSTPEIAATQTDNNDDDNVVEPDEGDRDAASPKESSDLQKRT